MIVFAPYDYENRLVTPMYLFVAVFAAVGLTGGWTLAVRCWKALVMPPPVAAKTSHDVASPTPNSQLPTPTSRPPLL
jgi:hypothetical protein